MLKGKNIEGDEKDNAKDDKKFITCSTWTPMSVMSIHRTGKGKLER